MENYSVVIGDMKYYSENDLRKALGTVDEYVDILGVIKKLREERDGLKANLELTKRLYKENRDFVDKVCEAVDITRPHTESGYDNAVKSIAGFKRERDNLKDNLRIAEHAMEAVTEHELKTVKQERDKLKDRLRTYRLIANGTYGDSCGYSGDKAPAFLCNVISYNLELSPIEVRSLMDEPSYCVRNDTIRVELELTPTVNYKGTFDLEDLKRYIQEYGREKKLSDFEIFCKLANNCIDELCDKYNVVQPDRKSTTKERLDYIFAVLAEHRDLANNNFNKAEGFRKEKRIIADSLAELRAKIREIYLAMYLTGNDEPDSYIERLNLIHEEYERVVHNFKERTADWSKAQQELDRYRLAVGSLLDIPKEIRYDINAIERAFTFSKKQYMSLKEFRDNVCEILDIPSSMADDQEQILKEIRDFADGYYELRDFRGDICEVLGIDADELFGSPQQNDQYILAQAEKLKDNSTSLDRYARFRSNICTALCLGGETRDEDILNAITKSRKKCNDLIVFRNDVAKAIGLAYIDINSDIINRVMGTKECYDKLCEDYTELIKAIWDAMDRKPETLPDETARLVGEVAELARGEKLLIEFRDAVAEAIGITYPTTNNFLLTRVSDIYKERGEAHDLAMELDRKCIDLTAKNSDLQQKFEFQSGLRQQWHARYESEHKRANGEHKRAEKLRSDVTALKNHIELLKLTNASQANSVVALQAFKNECRKLKDEKTKVIAALGQDIWDDCLK